MVFKRLKGMFGGGTTVQTVVHTPVAQPGGTLQGVVEIVGGEVEQEINYLALALVARVEVETDDSEHQSDMSFAQRRVHGAFTLHPGQHMSVPFYLDLPLETPFNVLGGHDLHSVRLGLRTELDIARSVDKGDFDPIRVAALPAQERILAAFERIGCRFKSADLERGRCADSTLGFYQELEFAPSPEFARAFAELEVTFLAKPDVLDVVIEADRRGGFLSSGGDSFHRLSIPYQAIDHEDWESILRRELQQMGQRRGLFG